MDEGMPVGSITATIADIWCIVMGKHTHSKENESCYGDDNPFIKTPNLHGNTFVIKTD
jgi:type I restriction enzyme S subunit